jgi:signal transduction histidine kinase/CheY-like chemotaxis protein
VAVTLRHDRPFQAFAAVGLLLTTSYFALPAGPLKSILGPVTDLIMLGSLLAAILWRLPDWSLLARRFWQLWAAGLGSWVAVALIDLAVELSGWQKPFGRALNLARTLSFTGIYLGAIVAIELRPHARAAESRGEGLRWLAALGSALTALALLVYLVILPSIFDFAVLRSNVPASVLYLCLDCFLLWRLTSQAADAQDRWRAVYATLFGVVALWTLSDGAEVLRWTGWLAEARFLWLVDLIWLPQFLGLMLAARIRGSEAEAAGAGEARGTQLLALTLLLPAFHAVLLADGAWAPDQQAAAALWLLAVLLLLGSLTVVYLRRLEQLAEARANELQVTHAALAASVESMRVARDQAESANRTKSQFLANMSHEVRTPLNGVLGMTELLIESGLTPSQRRLADLARSSGESLLSIVDDILDFSRIEAGRLELEQVSFDLRETVESVIELLGERARAKNLELCVQVAREAPDVVRGDPGRLRQVLINLVGNAVKFTPQGEILVRVGVLGPAGPSTRLEFEVHDTGIGIAPEAVSRIFDAFAQADGSTTRRYGGTGLGLAICKQLVGLMGGELKVESTLGVGTRFRFSASFGVEVTALRKPASARLLILAGSATVRLSLEEQCAHLGYRAASASDGVPGLGMLREAATRGAAYDLVILDPGLPPVNGLEVAAAIRNDPGIPTVKLIVMTSSTGDPVGSTAEGAGARLLKPVRESELRRCVSRALGQSVEGDGSSPARGVLTEQFEGRVLLVEDGAVNLAVAEGMLSQMGPRVDLASDGEEALAALSRASYDLVLMDCMMPGMDGYAATAELRRRERGSGRRTPVAALTANAMSGDRERCVAAGMDDYLSKPFRHEDLRQLLARWLPARKVETGASAGAPPRLPA